MAPATIVAVLGYVSLRQWEASADLLFREQARDVVCLAVMVKSRDEPVLVAYSRDPVALRSARPPPAPTRSSRPRQAPDGNK